MDSFNNTNSMGNIGDDLSNHSIQSIRSEFFDDKTLGRKKSVLKLPTYRNINANINNRGQVAFNDERLPHPFNNYSEPSNWTLQGKFFCKEGSCFNVTISCNKCSDGEKHPNCLKAFMTQNLSTSDCTAKLLPTNISVDSFIDQATNSIFVLNVTNNKESHLYKNSSKNSDIIVIASSLPAPELAKVARKIRKFLTAYDGMLAANSSDPHRHFISSHIFAAGEVSANKKLFHAITEITVRFVIIKKKNFTFWQESFQQEVFLVYD
jgi:hypothetical protein